MFLRGAGQLGIYIAVASAVFFHLPDWGGHGCVWNCAQPADPTTSAAPFHRRFIVAAIDSVKDQQRLPIKFILVDADLVRLQSRFEDGSIAFTLIDSIGIDMMYKCSLVHSGEESFPYDYADRPIRMGISPLLCSKRYGMGFGLTLSERADPALLGVIRTGQRPI